MRDQGLSPIQDDEFEMYFGGGNFRETGGDCIP